jgi:hypothetical protein
MSGEDGLGRNVCGEKAAQWPPCRLVVSFDKRVPMSNARHGNAFVFGVSGHRDLVPADLPELRRHLRDIFRRFMSEHPKATFELLTPLAEGADRIAAHEALSAGIKLVIPMPMAQADYERDFTTAESLAEFRQLLEAASSQFELSTPASADRVQRYAAVGEYIARKSNVLILLWDGHDNQKVGGTAWVKNRREHWEKESGSGLETIHLRSRRVGSLPRS